MRIINSRDIMETIEMLTAENLDVRTVTMGISLLDCIDPDGDKACEKIYNKIVRLAGNLVPVVDGISAEYGIPIVNKRISVTPMALVAGGLLLALYAAYLTQIVLPGMPKMLRLPAVLYTLVSIAGFTVALTSGDAVYASAIALLLFSDTMIAAADFAGRKELSFLILPTYYLCHILIALSAMLG